jgi:isopentenyl-diphosphate delta-isomerase
VGNGISGRDARRLFDCGVQVIDVAGAGGTSWSEVERFRQQGEQGRRVAGAFADWGLPTTECIRQVRAAVPEATIIGSGGVRSGVDVAKAIALGADLAGTAKPALVSAMALRADASSVIDERGAEAVIEGLQAFISELRVAMFCAGCGNLGALRELGRGA